MKRILLITVLGVYALLSVGMQLHLHYCCGKLSDFHFLPSGECNHATESDEDHCCKKENCCSFIHIDLKVDDSHQPSETARFIPLDVAPTFEFSVSEQPVLTGLCGFSADNHSPPPISRRYVLYRSLVLYA